MTGPRLIVGIIVMGIAVPATIFFLLDLHTPAQFFTVSATTFLAWGLADLLASILARPRLENRSPGLAIKEDLDRRRDSGLVD
ncbi:MAG: hypothetical protein QOE82_2920 [Thermoanaerobaculia bacterium]|jgi:hypothetical protein|nr:hypothetical protein [Thermoanaerobaculia bacterium]